MEVVKTSNREEPRSGNTTPFSSKSKAGRASCVWFTQASMFRMSAESDGRGRPRESYEALTSKSFKVLELLHGRSGA